jgi:hypothetical protein
VFYVKRLWFPSFLMWPIVKYPRRVYCFTPSESPFSMGLGQVFALAQALRLGAFATSIPLRLAPKEEKTRCVSPR